MTNPTLRFRERVNQAYPRFTDGDRKIADHLLRTYPTGLLESASAIAETLRLHVSTVTRFFPKIGYANIRAANQDVREALDFLMAPPLARVRGRNRAVTDDTALFEEVQRLDLKNIQDTFADLSFREVRRFLRLLLDRKRSVFLFGARKHFSLCFYAFIQLNGVRDNVFLAPTGNFYVADLLARVRRGDVLWLFDFRRYPRIGSKVAAYCKQVGAEIVLFTDSPLAPAARYADLQFISTTGGASSFDSYAGSISLINAFLAEYARRAPEMVRRRYEVQEALFRHFDIFTWQDRLPAHPRSR
jgi:DNA-binding MurR/RpiR family transcriptional regulator